MNKLLLKKIRKYQNIIIAKHIRPDWDAQGSALGLAYLIANNCKNKQIIVVGSRLDDNHDFAAQNLSEAFIKSALVITVDTANQERIDFPEFILAKETFKIDHHINVNAYADYELVDESAIACTQIITLWAQNVKWKFTPDAATNLYKGLLTDSGRFLFNKINPNTFAAAKILLENGADFKQIHNSLYVSDLKKKQYLNFAFNKMQLSKQGVGSIVITKADQVQWDYKYEDFKSALGTMGGLNEVKIWVLVIEWEDENTVSLRSRDYPINLVASKYNGGGHAFASGCKLSKLSDLKQLIKDLDKVIKEGK